MKRGSKNKDRLSDLCDSIILHILSFLDTKQAVQTCILSTRWKNVAKHLPILRLCSLNFKSHCHSKKKENFKSHCSFGNSVSRALSLRDHSTTLHTLDLMDSYDFVEPDILKSIVEYAISHNVRLLRISITCDLQQFSPCLFSSQTLTFVDLCVHPAIECREFPNSLNLPALTTLTLKSFYFCAGDDGCAEPFSAFNKLNTLVMVDCQLLDEQILCISSTTLVNLTVDACGQYSYSYICKLFTPSLCNLNFIGTLDLDQKLFNCNLCSFKHVYIDVRKVGSRTFDYPFLLNLIQELVNIKSLTVSSSTLQVLSLIPDLFKVKLTSLYNLESLQVKVNPLSHPTWGNVIGLEYRDFRKFEPDRIVEFFLQNSPSAKVINIYD